MKPAPKKRPMDKEKKGQHPETIGSKLAAKARKIANSLTDDKREGHLRKALAIIHGSSGNKTVSCRR